MKQVGRSLLFIDGESNYCIYFNFLTRLKTEGIDELKNQSSTENLELKNSNEYEVCFSEMAVINGFTVFIASVAEL